MLKLWNVFSDNCRISKYFLNFPQGVSGCVELECLDNLQTVHSLIFPSFNIWFFTRRSQAIGIFTASYRKVNSVYPHGGGMYPDMQWTGVCIPACNWVGGGMWPGGACPRYGQQGGCMHPTRMLSCWFLIPLIRSNGFLRLSPLASDSLSNRIFHKLDKIGNNANIGIKGFTTRKKSSDKMLHHSGNRT